MKDAKAANGKAVAVDPEKRAKIKWRRTVIRPGLFTTSFPIFWPGNLRIPESMPHRSGARGDTRLFHTTPAILIFGLFSGSTATGELSPGSSAIALCTMHNENTAHYLDTNKFHDYAIELTRIASQTPRQAACSLISACDVIPGKISPCIRTA